MASMFNDFASLKSETAKAAPDIVKPNVETPPASLPTDLPAESGGQQPPENKDRIIDEHSSEHITPPATTAKDDVTGEPGNEPAVGEQAAAGTPGIQPPAPDEGSGPASTEMETAAKLATDNLLKELGVDSLDTLKARLKPAAELSPEEKKRQEDLLGAAVQHYAVSELKYDPQEFLRLNNYKQLSDQDLAFDMFKDAFVEQIKDDPAYADKDLMAEAREEFDKAFHVGSDDERLSKWGQKMLSDIAAATRSSQDARYKEAEGAYLEVQHKRSMIPAYRQVIGQVMGTIPDKMSWDIEDGTKVVFHLDKLDKAALEKTLVNDDSFKYFMEQGGQKTADWMKAKVDQYIAVHHQQDMLRTAIKTSYDTGLKKAAVGAKAPFNMPSPVAPDKVDPTKITEADDQKVRSVLGRDSI